MRISSINSYKDLSNYIEKGTFIEDLKDNKLFFTAEDLKLSISESQITMEDMIAAISQLRLAIADVKTAEIKESRKAPLRMATMYNTDLAGHLAVQRKNLAGLLLISSVYIGNKQELQRAIEYMNFNVRDYVHDGKSPKGASMSLAFGMLGGFSIGIAQEMVKYYKDEKHPEERKPLITGINDEIDLQANMKRIINSASLTKKWQKNYN